MSYKLRTCCHEDLGARYNSNTFSTLLAARRPPLGVNHLLLDGSERESEQHLAQSKRESRSVLVSVCVGFTSTPGKCGLRSIKISLDWRVCVRIVLMGSEDCLLRVASVCTHIDR